jgi:hypothetical protein
MLLGEQIELAVPIWLVVAGILILTVLIAGTVILVILLTRNSRRRGQR